MQPHEPEIFGKQSNCTFELWSKSGGCESVLGLLFKLSCLCFCSDSNLNLKYLYLLLLLFFLKSLMMIILCWFDMELKLNFFSYAMIYRYLKLLLVINNRWYNC